MPYRVTNTGSTVITVYDKRGTKDEKPIVLLPSKSCITQDKIPEMASLKVEEIKEKPKAESKLKTRREG
jgi:hypothetical protein